MKVDLIFFAEDPGAANYQAGLLRSERSRYFRHIVYANGLAREHFKRLGIEFSEPGNASALDLMARHHPGLVILGTSENPHSFAHELNSAAREAGIPTAAVIDAMMNAAARFSGNSGEALRHLPDYVFVSDNPTRQEYESLGVAANQILVCGHPHFDWVREQAPALRSRRQAIKEEIFPSTLRGRKIVAFISEGAHQLLGPDLGAERRMEQGLDQTLAALGEIENPPALVVRPHPKDKLEWYAAYSGRIDHFSLGGNPLEFVMAADYVVGMTSMLMIEAALLGLPILSWTPNPAEAEWLPPVRNKATVSATSAADFRQQLKTMVEDPVAYSPQREFIVPGAAGRVWNEVQKILVSQPRTYGSR